MHELSALSAQSLRDWLTHHKAGIAMGIEPGQIARTKADRFRSELIRRGESLN